MIGAGLKKLGEELNLTVHNGKLSGIVCGFPVMLWDLFDCKVMSLHLGAWAKEGERADALSLLTKKQAAYRIQTYQTFGDNLDIVFFDVPGTMKRIRGYIETELPVLRDAGYTGAQNCARCGQPMNGETPTLLAAGVDIFAMHSRCAAEAEIPDPEPDVFDRPRTPPIAWLGAVLGGIVGSIPCVVLYVVGYIASMVAALIALGVGYGYKLLGGKPGKLSFAMIIVITLLVSVLAVGAGLVCDLGYSIFTGELQSDWGVGRDEIQISDTFSILQLALSDEEVRPDLISEWVSSLALNLLFSCLGIAIVWKRLKSQHLPQKRARIERIPA